MSVLIYFYIVIWIAVKILLRWLHITHRTFQFHMFTRTFECFKIKYFNGQVQRCLLEIRLNSFATLRWCLGFFYFFFILKQTRALFTLSFLSVININECTLFVEWNNSTYDQDPGCIADVHLLASFFNSLCLCWYLDEFLSRRNDNRRGGTQITGFKDSPELLGIEVLQCTHFFSFTANIRILDLIEFLTF